MQFNFINGLFSIALIASLAVFTTGCGKQADSGNVKDGSQQVGHDLDGWWCNEHGVPEAKCSLCSSQAAAKFKAKGDWCEKHNRAESQCFKCDPSRAEKFAKLYEAKSGHKPPKPSE